MDGNLSVVGIIPARMASSRFPGKPLALIQNIPMIGHVYHRCKMNSVLKEVFVATCDEEIANYISGIGGRAIMTALTHERASDRTAEALRHIENESGEKADIIVMIQGDEPMLHPDMIDQALQPFFAEPSVLVSNLLLRIRSAAEQEDKNEVKVVINSASNALYFSREPIPSRWKNQEASYGYKQVCVIPFRRDFLLKYIELNPTPLEILESVDMLRVLEHGFDVRMVPTEFQVFSVDTPEDLRKVDQLMKDDPLLGKYASP